MLRSVVKDDGKRTVGANVCGIDDLESMEELIGEGLERWI